MTKTNRSHLLTAVFLGVICLIVILRQSDWSWSDRPSGERNASTPRSDRSEGPKEVLYKLLDAAREGDAAAYIACYAGETARRLEQSRDEMSAERFAQYLRKRNQEIKGIAIQKPQFASPSESRIEVEYVYKDRNEAQNFYLEKIRGEWRIVGVDAAERVETIVPYGAAVY